MKISDEQMNGCEKQMKERERQIKGCDEQKGM
jgi:hypothetical protein